MVVYEVFINDGEESEEPMTYFSSAKDALKYVRDYAEKGNYRLRPLGVDVDVLNGNYQSTVTIDKCLFKDLPFRQAIIAALNRSKWRSKSETYRQFELGDKGER